MTGECRLSFEEEMQVPWRTPVGLRSSRSGGQRVRSEVIRWSGDQWGDGAPDGVCVCVFYFNLQSNRFSGV